MIQQKKRFSLGIIGGMGPLATVDFMARIIEYTQATCDQDHMPMLIEHCPDIPDRTASILNKDSSVTEELYRIAKRLEDRGVSAIAVPCNTAHYFINQFRDQLRVPVIHIIENTVSVLPILAKDQQKIGVLATNGSIYSGVFDAAFEKKNNFEPVYLRHNYQEELMTLIRDLKKDTNINSDHYKKRFGPFLSQLLSEDVRTCILGCTELSLVFRHLEQYELEGKIITFLDTTTILAQACVEFFNHYKREDYDNNNKV
jgi:aspartate racemase